MMGHTGARYGPRCVVAGDLGYKKDGVMCFRIPEIHEVNEDRDGRRQHRLLEQLRVSQNRICSQYPPVVA